MKKLFLIIFMGILLTACSSDCFSDNCSTKKYTVRQPVEVIYQNTTYETVYEPKTYKRTTYERVPYNCAKSDICR